MHTLLTILHVIVAVFMVLVILLQTGKGANMGSAFGGGASQTMFGSSGAGNFLTKLTTAAAIIFMITSLTLTTMTSKRETRSVIKDEAGQSAKPQPEEKKAPAPGASKPTAEEDK
jgi:preprotein translocase subunit SecG